MNVIKITTQALILLAIFPPSSAAQQATKADKAIEAVKQLCLTGTQYDLKTDAQGNLTLLKLTPGATGKVSVNVRSSSGAAAIFDEKVRKEADEDIRKCIQPHIQKIIDAILQSGDVAITVTYRPPAIKGDIYAVINKNTDQIIDIFLEWGMLNEKMKIDLSNYDGLILHLKHTYDDSFVLKLATNGKLTTEPYQGERPKEWDNAKYKKVPF